ncbi:MAG: class I SAM-dependent methyltransferase [Candidatus Paceibacterota bacterium]|jgi:ubiquinone/menaquinone biosynthesis C-methylase UbiE
MKENKPPKENKTSWGEVADWYDDMLEQNRDSFQEKVILPNLLRMVEPEKGMTILDLACGQGYFVRAFHEKGATVMASDISPELIDIARKHSSKEIEYFIAPADSMEKVQDKSVDVVTIILAIQNIENLQGTISESARVLKAGGRLIFVINHPAFRIPKRSAWGWDETEKKQYRRIDAYMSDNRIEIDMTPGEKLATKKRQTLSFHRPLQAYFKSLNKSGLAVTRFEEWISHKASQPGPRAVEEDRIRKEIPMFLCIESKKI